MLVFVLVKVILGKCKSSLKVLIWHNVSTVLYDIELGIYLLISSCSCRHNSR